MNTKELISQIKETDKDWKIKAVAFNDSLVKPVGSLGKLEEIAVQLSAIFKTVKPCIKKKVTIVMAADNGIVEENIASSPVELTQKVTLSMAQGRAGISAMSRSANADVCVVDVGINGYVEHKNIWQEKIRMGTRNFLYEPAMTIEEVESAIMIGVSKVKHYIDQGYNLFGTGEMGIGNTTTSSAIIMSLLQTSLDESVGKGAGLTDDGLLHKKEIILKGLKFHGLYHQKDEEVQWDYDQVMKVLACVGGLDIAGLVGVYLGAAYYQVPVVIDGVISVAAALIAYKLNPLVSEYMISSHCSMEPAYSLAIKAIGLDPLLQLNMRLGEGTGCPLTFNIIGSACEMMESMIKFEEINVCDDYMIDLRKDIKVSYE